MDCQLKRDTCTRSSAAGISSFDISTVAPGPLPNLPWFARILPRPHPIFQGVSEPCTGDQPMQGSGVRSWRGREGEQARPGKLVFLSVEGSNRKGQSCWPACAVPGGGRSNRSGQRQARTGSSLDGAGSSPMPQGYRSQVRPHSVR